MPDRFYVDPVDQGEKLFRLLCEGIAAKCRLNRKPIENHKLFERRYEEKGAPETAWDVCDRACAAASGV